MHQNQINVRILVSKYIFGSGDQSSATACYTQLYNAGITIKLAWSYGMYFYNHVSHFKHLIVIFFSRLFTELGPYVKITLSFLHSTQQKYWIVDNRKITLSTGNWAPTDYPGPPNSYPPFSAGASWRNVNRDFTVSYSDAQVVKVFQDVLDADYDNSTTFYPKALQHEDVLTELHL